MDKPIEQQQDQQSGKTRKVRGLMDTKQVFENRRNQTHHLYKYKTKDSIQTKRFRSQQSLPTEKIFDDTSATADDDTGLVVDMAVIRQQIHNSENILALNSLKQALSVESDAYNLMREHGSWVVDFLGQVLRSAPSEEVLSSALFCLANLSATEQAEYEITALVMPYLREISAFMDSSKYSVAILRDACWIIGADYMLPMSYTHHD